MSWIDKLVGRSPIRPMQKHMQAALACAQKVIPLVEAMAAGDDAAITACRAEIDQLEHDADDIKNEIRSHMPRRLLMAMERRDMLEILDYQDSIADVAQDIAELADQRSMHLPPALAGPLTALVIRSAAACEQGARIINELDELVETGFGDREVARVEEMINELNRIETETDELQDTAARTLFSLEAELGVQTVYLHQTILWVADLADYAERVGNRLRLLIAT